MADHAVAPFADAFRGAIADHAAALAEEDSPAIAMATDRLQQAATAYLKAVREKGWYFELEAPEDDDDDWDDDEDDEDTFEVEPETPRFTLRLRWDVVVRDPAALRAHAALRMLEEDECDEDELDEHIGDPGSALNELLGLDLVFDYPGTEDAGANMSVVPTEKTLFEMTPDERDQANERDGVGY